MTKSRNKFLQYSVISANKHLYAYLAKSKVIYIIAVDLYNVKTFFLMFLNNFVLKVSIEFYNIFCIALAIYVLEGVDFRFFLGKLICRTLFLQIKAKNHVSEEKEKKKIVKHFA